MNTPRLGTRKSLLLVLACLLALGACGGGGGAGSGASSSAPSSTSGEFPMTVETCGRKVTFDKRPQRALVMDGMTATLVVAAGAGDRITAYASGRRPFLGPAQRVVDDPRVQKLSNPDELSREAIIGARPDVVTTSFAPNGFTPEDLDASGIKTVFVSGYCQGVGFPVKDTRSRFELIYSDIEIYGRLFGTADVAAKAVTDLRKRVAAVQEQLAGTPERSAATIGVKANGSLGSYGNESMQHEMMKILGLRNVFGDQGGRYFDVNPEEVIARNPETIIAIFQRVQGTETAESTRRMLLSRPEFANVAAIRNSRILVIESAYTLDGGTLAFEGLEQLAQQLTALK